MERLALSIRWLSISLKYPERSGDALLLLTVIIYSGVLPESFFVMLSSTSILPISSFWFISSSGMLVTSAILFTLVNDSNILLFLSHPFITPTSTVKPDPPINPNTTMNISGNTRVNTIADGFLFIARRLAAVIANIALTLLYLLFVLLLFLWLFIAKLPACEI